MMHHKSHATKSTKRPKPLNHIENSTDATRGEPLAMRAQKRQVELEAVLEKLPADDRTRADIATVVASISAHLTGDPHHLADSTAAELSRLLENTKHLGETVPVARSHARH